MKVAVVLATVISIAVCGPMYLPSEEELQMLDIGANMTYFLVEHEEMPGHYIVEDLVTAQLLSASDEQDVTYYFYSQQNVENGFKIKSDNVDVLSGTDFSVSKETLLIIHGWKNDYQSDVNVMIKKAVLSKYDVNVIVVDWSPMAGRNYISARWVVTDVGQYVANFLYALESKFGLQLTRVSVAGHSLGAHVSGNAGAAVKGVFKSIVGMDPALPLFTIGNVDNRLDPTDAKYVQVIHTCGGLLGFSAPIGHVDHYPNGGSSQPGCGLDITGSCAHSRSYQYYAESVVPLANPFVGTQCSTYKAYNNGQCSDNPKSNMGGFEMDKEAGGVYYLNTNDKSPFSQS